MAGCAHGYYGHCAGSWRDRLPIHGKGVIGEYDAILKRYCIAPLLAGKML